MDIVINNSIETPIYRQIYEQIVAQILNGTLVADYCLPSIRAIARDLEISVITVKNAYEMLEQDKFIYTILGKGCFVSAIAKTDLQDKKDCLIREKAEEILEFCAQFGVDKNKIIEELKKS